MPVAHVFLLLLFVLESSRANEQQCNLLSAILILPGSSFLSVSDWKAVTNYTEMATIAMGVGNVTFATQLGYMRDTGVVEMRITEDSRVLYDQLNRMRASSPTGAMDLA